MLYTAHALISIDKLDGEDDSMDLTSRATPYLNAMKIRAYGVRTAVYISDGERCSNSWDIVDIVEGLQGS